MNCLKYGGTAISVPTLKLFQRYQPLIHNIINIRKFSLSKIICESHSQQQLQIQPVSLSYEIFHPKAEVVKSCQPPVLFLHGLMGNKRNFQGIAKSLTTTGKKVITVDCRNHGDSPHTSDMTYEAMSGDVELLLTDLDITEAVVVGHSMGGKVAMSLALTQPDVVRRLIVVDISPRRHVTADMVDDFPTYFSVMQNMKLDSNKKYFEVLEEGHKVLSPFVPEKTIRNFLLTNIKRQGNYYKWRVNFEALIENYRNIIGFPEYETSYLGSTLFIGGKQSLYIRDSDLEEIDRLFPCSRVVHVDGAGHWVHADQPRQFIDLINEFVDER